MRSVLRWIPVAGAIAALMATLFQGIAFASGEATAISVAGPESASLGDEVTLQAVLVGGDGGPIAGVRVLFSDSADFLGVSGDALLGVATTDEGGLAVLRWRVTRTGRLTVRAAFPGDDRYAPSLASTEITVEGDRQLYAERAGVHLPGINTPPPIGPSLFTSLAPVAPIAGGLWPALSGWPIALVLLTVWGLYAFAVAMTFRVVTSIKTEGRQGQ